MPAVSVRAAVREGLAALLRAAVELAAAKPTGAERRAIRTILTVMMPASTLPLPPQGPKASPRPRKMTCKRCGRPGHTSRAAACPKGRERRSKPAAAHAGDRSGESSEPPGAPQPELPEVASAAGEPFEWDPDLDRFEPLATVKLPTRKWTTTPRAASVPPKGLTRRERRLHLKLLPWFGQRPRTRGECEGVPRPCPFVSCAHHLFLDVHPETGTIRLNFPHLEPDQMIESCALDVADRVALGGTREVPGGSLAFDELGKMLNVSLEGASQVVDKAIAELRTKVVT